MLSRARRGACEIVAGAALWRCRCEIVAGAALWRCRCRSRGRRCILCIWVCVCVAGVAFGSCLEGQDVVAASFLLLPIYLLIIFLILSIDLLIPSYSFLFTFLFLRIPSYSFLLTFLFLLILFYSHSYSFLFLSIGILIPSYSFLSTFLFLLIPF